MTKNDEGTPLRRQEARGVSPRPERFPDIMVDIKGDIILCIACKGSNLSRQDDGKNDEGHPSEDKRREECPSTAMANIYVCNDCGTVWWQ